MNAETAWPLARKQEAKTTLPWYNTCRFAKRWLKSLSAMSCMEWEVVGLLKTLQKGCIKLWHKGLNMNLPKTQNNCSEDRWGGETELQACGHQGFSFTGHSRVERNWNKLEEPCNYTDKQKKQCPHHHWINMKSPSWTWDLTWSDRLTM